MTYGYARVSTKGQAKDGTSLEAQEALLRSNGATEIYFDAFTGTKMDRPEFSKLLGVLKAGDTLVVAKLDRFARSVSQATDVITALIDKGVTVNVLNLGVLSNDSVSILMRNILLSFAQFERDMIVQRTSEGKAVKRAKGELVEGRPKIVIDGFEDYLSAVKSGEKTVKECCTELGISRATWYNKIKEIA